MFMIKECTLCFDTNTNCFQFSWQIEVTCATNLHFEDFYKKKFVVIFHDSKLLDLLLICKTKHCEISKSFEPFICPAHQGLLDQI